MPNIRHPMRSSSLALTVLAVIRIAIGTTAIPITASFADEMSGTEFVWTGLVVTLTAILIAGLALRTARPHVSTVLLTVGAAAPALAWFWLPPTYVLSAAIAITAIATRRRPTPART